MPEGEGGGKFKGEKLKKKSPEAELFDPEVVQLPARITPEVELVRGPSNLPDADRITAVNTDEQDLQGSGVEAADIKTGVYTGPDGREWVQLGRLEKLLGVSREGILPRLEDVATMKVRGRGDQLVVVYPVDISTERLAEFTATPEVDPRTGIYTDMDGREWAAVLTLAKLLGVSSRAVAQRVGDAATIKIRNRRGNLLDAYPVELVRSRLAELIAAPAVDESTGIYTDMDGREWMGMKTLEKLFGVSNTAIMPRLKNTVTIKVRDRIGGKLIDAYPIDLARERLAELISTPGVDPQTGIYTDKDGREWVPMAKLVKLLDISSSAITPRLENTASIKVRDRGGKLVDAYLIDFVKERLAEFLSAPEVDPQTGIYTDKDSRKWAPVATLVKLFSVSSSVIPPRLEGMTSVQVRHRGGHVVPAYPIDLVEDRLMEFVTTPEVDPQTGIYTDKNGREWTGVKTLEKILGASTHAIVRRLEGISAMRIRGRGGELIDVYPIDLVRARLAELVTTPEVNKVTGIYTDEDGQQWAGGKTLAKLLGVDVAALHRLEDLKVRKVRDRSGKLIDAHPVNLVKERLAEFLSAPGVDPQTGIYTDGGGREWAALDTLKDLFLVSRGIITSRLEGISVMKIRGRGGALGDAYPIDLVRERLRSISELTPQIKEKKDLENHKQDMVDFVRGIETGNASEQQVLEKLIAACGSSRAIDILFKFRPEYTKIPIDYVKNVLAEYLGDYLSVKRPFKLNDINPELAVYFSDLTLKEGLKETIKQDCLAFYYKERKSGSKKSDQDVIDAYLDHAVDALGDLGNADVDDVVQEVVAFFNDLFTQIDRPPKMVERLGADRREFPDVNQRINYHELKDKKRLLIADEMGLGKSGSVVFAKEALGVKQAVLVVPSNVIPTWEKYLSDSRADGGYFKAGLPPNALTVQNLSDLQKSGIADKDYIIISHERLADPAYVEELQKLDIGMLAVDEMHLLKNLAGKRAEQLVELSKKIEGEDKYLALLSGTPVPNTVKDIAMTLKLLYPEKFGEMNDRTLVTSILKGDLLDLRSLLLPRMQMKSLRESVEMPELREVISSTELEGLERDIYEMLLEEDELSPMAKLQILRQFLLNPELVDPTPGIESSKITALNDSLTDIYQTKKKVVVFVNGYVEDILRGEKGIAGKLNLPEGVEISTIHGEISKDERVRLQEQLKITNKKMLMLVSGQTAGVGVDFSSADEVIFYNEPWTKYEKGQQLSRVYRPGLTHDLSSSTLLAAGTIEEGIHKHIEAKYKSIEKLLNGIPLTEIEQEMLKVSEDEVAPNAEVNPELARYYFSSWERMMSIFAHVKEIGETDFQEFLGKFSREYAECYMELGSRSYQANANRITGALIDSMVRDTGRRPHDVTILDTASGPEMLKRHIPDFLRDRVVSMDLNAAHFSQGEGKRVVGSFLNIPLRADSVDYAAMTLAWHYTNFVPSQGKIERVQALKELHTVLKPGGRAILNLMYSLDIRKPEQLKPALERMGFVVVEEYSGDIAEADRYASKIVTIEKIRENKEVPQEIVDALVAADLVDGLKFRQNKRGLRNSRGVLTSFVLNGKKHEIPLNEDDKAVHEEERILLDRGEQLKDQYEEIRLIPPQEVTRSGFSRVFNGKRYVLFSKLKTGPGVVVIK